jgi:recombination protein RecR
LNFPSKLIEDAVSEISKLPGIGKKTALRLALHLLKKDVNTTQALTEALTALRTQTTYCLKCHNISDDILCRICTSINRNQSVICLVQDTRDVLAIENTGQYTGLYHVLGGIISPLMGIGPNNLNIDSLIKRVAESRESDAPVTEVIMALSPTMEGDTTAFYLQKKLAQFEIKMSTIARGIPIGNELEYADEITLGRSILSRTDYK